MITRSKKDKIILIGWLLPAFCLIYPLIRLFKEFLSLDIFLLFKYIFSKQILAATTNTIYVSFFGSFLALFTGLLLALIVVFLDIKNKRVFSLLFILPFLMPAQVLAIAWLEATSSSSSLLNFLRIAPEPFSTQFLYSNFGIIFLFLLHFSPISFLYLRAGLKQINPELIESARLSGGTWFFTLKKIILPLLKPQLTSSFVIIFLSCLGNFAIPALLGRGNHSIFLTTLIYQNLSSLTDKFIEISSSCVVLIFIALTCLLFTNNSQTERLYVHRSPLQLNLSFPVPKGVVYFGYVFLGIFIFLSILFPGLSLFVSSVLPDYTYAISLNTLSLKHYIYILYEYEMTRSSIINSLILASSTSILLAIMCFPTSYLAWTKLKSKSQILTGLFGVSYFLPGVILGIGIILTYSSPLPFVGISFYNTLTLIFLAYISKYLILQWYPLITHLSQLNTQWLEAADVCGAHTLLKLKKIVFPLSYPTLYNSSFLIFLVSLNEFNLSSILWSSGNETLGVSLYNLKESGEHKAAAALSSVSFLISLLALVIFTFFKTNKKGKIRVEA